MRRSRVGLVLGACASWIAVTWHGLEVLSVALRGPLKEAIHHSSETNRNDKIGGFSILVPSPMFYCHV